MIRTTLMLFLAVVLATACTVSATAQKKEAVKKEAPAPQQTQNTMKEVLSRFVGKATNMGTLKKVMGDHFILEEDGATVYHPLYTLHTIKVIKDEESGDVKVEIKLIGKD